MAISRTDKQAVKECMQLLASTVIKLDTKLEKKLYGQFETLLNTSFDLEIKNNVSKENVFEFDTEEELQEHLKK